MVREANFSSAIWILCTNTDGCYVDSLYSKPTLKAAMWILCMTTKTDCYHVDFLYGNRH